MGEKIIHVYSSFNMGDVIASLVGLKNICHETNSKLIIYFRLGLPMGSYFPTQNHPTIDENGQAVGINQSGFDMLKPLLESQYYIKEVRLFNGEKDFDYNLESCRKFSLLPLPAGQLQTYDSFTYPELGCDLSKPWIVIDYAKQFLQDAENGKTYYNTDLLNEHKKKHLNKIVISRTERYTNPYITYNFLKEHENNIYFVGTEREHSLFCNQWKLNIHHYKVKDFLQLAVLIMCCKFFMGNASFCWHLAEAMKVKRILEFCREFPNSSPIGEHGYQFLKQEALLYYFEKLNK